MDQFQTFLETYGPQILKGVLILIVGFWIAGWATRLVRRAINSRKLAPELAGFLSSMVSVLLKVVVLLAAAESVGIKTTSFIAILGAAGLAIGLALQGSLSNFAGGVMLLIFRPFKVGDLISAQGHTGFVQAINVFVTTILTPDNKTVIIPNGPLSNGDITNFSTDGKLRVDLVVNVAYKTDLQKAREVLMQVMESDPNVLKDPAPSVNVLELGEHGVKLAVRPWATPANYWGAYFGVTEGAKKALAEAGIEIPFPQIVVRQA